MTYHIHPVEDELNSATVRSPKIKHPELCPSEYSVAQSPRKVEDLRKLSTRIMIKDEAEMIGENERMFRIYPQFYMMVNNRELHVANLTPGQVQ
jgi:hypothetical protein